MANFSPPPRHKIHPNTRFLGASRRTNLDTLLVLVSIFQPLPSSDRDFRRQWPLIGPRSSRSNSLLIARLVAVIFAWNSCNRNFNFNLFLFSIRFWERGEGEILRSKIFRRSSPQNNINFLYFDLSGWKWKGNGKEWYFSFWNSVQKLILISAFYFCMFI